MQGNAPMHPGQGQGLSLRDLGEMGGAESVTLIESEIPNHTHTLRGNNTLAEASIPTGASIARQTFNMFQTNSAANLTQMAFQALAPAGGSLPHNNMQPFLVLNFCIALQGVFPARP
jgi:microcystin-dependent protein